MSSYWLKYRGALIPLRREETIVGRSAYCSIVVASPRASRQHCVLSLRGTALTITDLASTNGTKVNGEALISARELTPGDVISIGNEQLQVVVAEDGDERLGRETASNSQVEFEEQSTTDASFAALDLITALVESANGRPETRSEAMDASITALLQRLELVGGRLSQSDARRMSWAVTSAAKWFSDGCKDAWRDELLARIDKAAG